MTTLNIVAHPDDDLLFLNPDIAEDIERGEPVFVIYLTLGDDGNNEQYIEMRRDAARKAYDNVERKHLIFYETRSSCVRLNNPYGELCQLWNNPTYVSLYADPDRSWYFEGVDRNDLLTILTHSIDRLRPDLIRIQDPGREPALTHDEPQLDHVDHIYGAKFALEAAKQFPHIPVYAYASYPLRYELPNLTPEQIELKTRMWRAYQSIDTSVQGEIWDVALVRCYKRRVQ